MTERDTFRWIIRISALLVLLIGWVFIAAINRFYVGAPMVFACLGWLAVVATIYNLWRTGASAAAAAEGEETDDSTWAKPAGALGELEREKRTLLKAIKEAEFDHQMGKLSKRDVDDMIGGYRARAIEVIKEIDRLSLGAAGGPREQIMREVKARLALDAQSKKPASKQAKAAAATRPAGKQAKPGKQPAADAAPAAAAQAPLPGHANDEAAPVPPTEPPDLDDEALNADSTTAIEPRQDATNDAAKEATP